MAVSLCAGRLKPTFQYLSHDELLLVVFSAESMCLDHLGRRTESPKMRLLNSPPPFYSEIEVHCQSMHRKANSGINRRLW